MSESPATAEVARVPGQVQHLSPGISFARLRGGRLRTRPVLWGPYSKSARSCSTTHVLYRGTEKT